MSLRIVGRSSSHFTRVLRMFAHELQLEYAFEPILDLMSLSQEAYAGNPALKMPALVTDEGAWFGALNGCRELARRARVQRRIVWPEDWTDRTASNAQELVLQGMATEVGLVMRTVAEPGVRDAYTDKARRSLQQSIRWLEDELPRVLSQLPERDLSFLEVTSFCFVTHLEFREVLDMSTYARLRELSRQFEGRPSARATEYQFDKG